MQIFAYFAKMQLYNSVLHLVHSGLVWPSFMFKNHLWTDSRPCPTIWTCHTGNYPIVYGTGGAFITRLEMCSFIAKFEPITLSNVKLNILWSRTKVPKTRLASSRERLVRDRSRPSTRPEAGCAKRRPRQILGEEALF